MDLQNAAPDSELAADGSQYLTFLLADEQFGIDILKVQEIKGFTTLTPIPNAPPFVKGVINLRGTVVPVVDLRIKFSMPEAAYDKFTVIVIVTVGRRVFGLIVDAVSDVLNIRPNEIQNAPTLGGAVDTAFLAGIARQGDAFVLLLDIDTVIGAGDEAPACAAR